MLWQLPGMVGGGHSSPGCRIGARMGCSPALAWSQVAAASEGPSRQKTPVSILESRLVLCSLPQDGRVGGSSWRICAAWPASRT